MGDKENVEIEDKENTQSQPTKAAKNQNNINRRASMPNASPFGVKPLKLLQYKLPNTPAPNSNNNTRGILTAHKNRSSLKNRMHAIKTKQDENEQNIQQQQHVEDERDKENLTLITPKQCKTEQVQTQKKE